MFSSNIVNHARHVNCHLLGLNRFFQLSNEPFDVIAQIFFHKSPTVQSLSLVTGTFSLLDNQDKSIFRLLNLTSDFSSLLKIYIDCLLIS